MEKKSKLPRGFKAKSERLSIEYRDKLGIHACAPLCAFKLANFLNVPIYNATEFGSPYHILNNGEYSALTMVTKVGNRIIIHNDLHTPARQQSNIMHELSHIICNHEGIVLESDLSEIFGMRVYDEVQEEEANCLGANLQISKAGLHWAKKNNLSFDEIAEHFKSSIEMARYRMHTTGIARIQSKN